VENGVSGNLGGAARRVVDVIALHSDHILGSGQVDGPVSVIITSGRVVSGAINVAVRDGNTTRSLGSEDNVLTADTSSLGKGLVSLLVPLVYTIRTVT